MKYIYTFLLLYFTATNSFSSSITFETLYNVKINLNNGRSVTGYFYSFNYDTLPNYSPSNSELLLFLQKASKKTYDTIEIYTILQNLNIPDIKISGAKFSAVVKKDLHRINTNDISSAEFISSCQCELSKTNCLVIKEFNQEEIDRIKTEGAKFIHSISDPNLELSPEAGNLHIALGKPGTLSQVEFDKMIKLLYSPNEGYFVFNKSKYLQLKNELRKKGVILLTLYVTDYSISNNNHE